MRSRAAQVAQRGSSLPLRRGVAWHKPFTLDQSVAASDLHHWHTGTTPAFQPIEDFVFRKKVPVVDGDCVSEGVVDACRTGTDRHLGACRVLIVAEGLGRAACLRSSGAARNARAGNVRYPYLMSLWR